MDKTGVSAMTDVAAKRPAARVRCFNSTLLLQAESKHQEPFQTFPPPVLTGSGSTGPHMRLSQSRHPEVGLDVTDLHEISIGRSELCGKRLGSIASVGFFAASLRSMLNEWRQVK